MINHSWAVVCVVFPDIVTRHSANSRVQQSCRGVWHECWAESTHSQPRPHTTTTLSSTIQGKGNFLIHTCIAIVVSGLLYIGTTKNICFYILCGDQLLLLQGSKFVSHPPNVYDLFLTAAVSDGIKLWDMRTSRWGGKSRNTLHCISHFCACPLFRGSIH